MKVTKIVENHNHLISKPLFQHLPRQRSLSYEQLDFVKKAMLIKGNQKTIQQKIQTSTGKNITLKDLSNIQQSVKELRNGNQIQDLVEHLKVNQDHV